MANAAWAIAKHYSNDKQILPPSFDRQNNALYSKGDSGSASHISLSQMWDLEEEGKNVQETRVLETLDDIALQLMDTMAKKTTRLDGGGGGGWRKPMNEAETSMVCWAYAILYPRNVPAGWELPPRVGRWEDEKQTQTETMQRTNNGNDDTITFETVQDSNNVVMQEEFKPTTVVDKLFDAMAQSIVRPQNDGLSTIQRCQWKELSTIAWSYANRGYCQSASSLNLILNLADAATARIEKASWVGGCDDILARDATQIAWALGVMQSDNYKLSDTLEQFISVINDNLLDNTKSRPFEHWTSADCVQMAVALAHGRLDRQTLLQEIYGEAVRSMQADLGPDRPSSETRTNKDFQDFELVVLLWVQARLYLTKDSGQVFDDFAELLPRTLLSRMGMANGASESSLRDIRKAFDGIDFGAQEQANLVWSLTVLEKYNSKDSIQLLRTIFSVCSATCTNGKPIRLEHAHQLWQSIFILEQECPEAIETVDEKTFNFLKDMWDQEKTRPKSSSARHEALSETLNFMGVKHYNEHDEDIDLALVLKTDSKWTHVAELCDSEDCKQRVAVE